MSVIETACIYFGIPETDDPRLLLGIQHGRYDRIAIRNALRRRLAQLHVHPQALTDEAAHIRKYVSELATELEYDAPETLIHTQETPQQLDYASLRLALDDVSPRSVKRGGTMIGDGIRLAQQSFTDDVQDHKAIIVLTDGEDMGSFPAEAAAEAAAAGILVYTVGIGDPITGSRIPTTRYGQPAFIEHEGKEVWSIMNAEELTNVASVGGGAFVPAGTANLDLASIYAQRIASDSGKSFDSVKLEQFIPRFQWFAIPALLLFLGDGWLSLQTPSNSRRRVYEVTS